MATRPKIELQLKLSDKILEILGWGLLIILWVIAIYYFSKMPEKIPTHYNIRGQVDSYGGSFNMFLPPIIATVLLIGLTILSKYPHIFNFPIEINEENVQRQYRMVTTFLRYLKIIIAFIFLLLEINIIRTSLELSEGMGRWTIPVILLLAFIPIIFYVRKSILNK